MTYENHINKFVDAAAIQAAVDNGDLLKPYVALDVSAGTIDYNTRSVTPPAPTTMGEWSINSSGHYILTITEHDTTIWDQQTITIGYLNNVYVNSQLTQSVETTLFFDDEASEWDVGPREGGKILFYDFISGTNSLPDIATDLASSDASVNVAWDAVNKTFTFSSGDADHPLTMTTVNPPYPGSPSESGSGSGSESGSGQLDEPTPEPGD